MRSYQEGAAAASQVTTSTQPRVSVVMTAGPDLRFLDDAVTSILSQDLADLELIIVDDASGQPEAIARQAERDPRVRVLSNAVCLGPFASANRAIATARAEIIARLDADDVALPARLRRLVGALHRHPDLGLVGSWFAPAHAICPHIPTL